MYEKELYEIFGKLKKRCIEKFINIRNIVCIEEDVEVVKNGGAF